MKNFNDIIQNSSENDNSLINLRINLDKVDELIQDKKILEILELVKQSFPFTFIGRQKIRRIIDQLDFAFWIKDPNKKFVIVNKLFAESVGLNLNKIEGQHQQDVLIESESKLLSSIDDYIVNSANSVVYETYSKTFSKEMNQNIEFPICDLDKNVVAIIGYNHKIDEIKTINAKAEILKESNFESLPNMLIEVDKEYVIKNYTNKFLFEFDLSKNDVMGKDITSLLKIDFSQLNDNRNNKVMIGNAQYLVELSGIKQEDETEGYFISFQNSEDDKSVVSEKMYDLIMQYSNEPMFIYSVEDLKFLKVNGAALKLYGYSEKEFLGMDLTDLYAPEDIQTLVETSSRDTIEHGFTGPWRHKKIDGSTVLVEISKTVADFEGTRSHLNIIKNISKNLQAEKEFQQYKIAFENTSDLIIFTDLEGFITFSNNRVEENLNFDIDSLNDKPFLSLVNDKDRAKINTGIFHANEMQSVTLETELKKSNGEFLPVEILSTPIYNLHHEVESFELVI
ncbi:MAG: PAS domain S-box protein, partial [Melioribacteraceae bacterium]|nr:PAS domain S-box protein [Melioribacteraceae bacterium]